MPEKLNRSLLPAARQGEKAMKPPQPKIKAHGVKTVGFLRSKMDVLWTV